MTARTLVAELGDHAVPVGRRPHRAVPAQQRVRQLEQGVRPSGASVRTAPPGSVR
ncbi:hypothetical protein [Streptomyces sp. NPDC060184]|uniref:hypothetical protein n=1 Tax=Streptomyces sp. NPDC060184 TaxID=3347064 RepID=UPI003655F6B3